MPEQPRTPLALAALATTAMPGLDVVGTRPPREPGADFDVAGIVDASDRRWVIRAPRHAAAGAALEGEAALLGELAQAVDAGLLPFEVPRPAGFAALPEGGRAMLYPEIVGHRFSPEQPAGAPVLRSLAHAVAALHELPGSVVRTAGLPDYDAESYRRRRLSEVDEAARTGHLPARLLRRWERALEDVSLWRFPTTPVHGDLTEEHVLVDGRDVVGIVDWSQARVADPADDLAWLLAVTSPAACEAVINHYAQARTGTVDDAFDARATLASELAVARWLMHGVRIRSDAVIEDAIDMLRELDEAVADAPRLGRAEPLVDPTLADELGDSDDHPEGDLVESEPVESEPDESEPASSGAATDPGSGTAQQTGPEPDDSPTEEFPVKP